MFVAIIGTRFAGKTSIKNYLVASKGFTSIRLLSHGSSSNECLRVQEVSYCSTFFLVSDPFSASGNTFRCRCVVSTRLHLHHVKYIPLFSCIWPRRFANNL